MRQLIIILYSITLIVMPYLVYADGRDIHVIVNDDIITNYDVKTRYNSFIAENNINILSLNTTQRQELEAHVIQLLIDDLLRKQLADTLDILPQDDAVNNHIKNLIRQQNMANIDQLKQNLARNSIDFDVYKEFLNQQFRWLAYTRQLFSANNPVHEADINAQIDSIKHNDGNNEYNIEELRIPFDLFSKDRAINIVQQIIGRLRQGVVFSNITNTINDINQVVEYSLLGWIVAEQYEDVDVNALRKNNPNANILGPVEVNSTFIILHITQQRTIKFNPDNINRDLIRQRLELQAERLFAERLLNNMRQDSFIEIR